MKKLLTLLLAISMIVPAATMCCSAASTTTLTTTVPGATYTLNIPADQEIPFGTTEMNIGTITATDTAGFAVGKNLSVAITYDVFKADGVSTTIPFTLAQSAPSAYGTTEKPIVSGSSLVFKGKSNGTVNEKITMTVITGNMGNSGESTISGILLLAESEDWGKALAGEYTATITFACEVVAE